MSPASQDPRVKHFQAAFGDVVRQHRTRLDVSQEKFAHKCGLHRTYISLIERGQKAASLKALFSVAKALDVKPHILIKEAEQYV